MEELPSWATGWEIAIREGETERATALVTGELPRYVRQKKAAAGVFDRMPPAVHCFGHFFEAVPWLREPDEEFWIPDFCADSHFPQLLNAIAPDWDATKWRDQLRALDDWFRTRAREVGITAGRSPRDLGRDERNRLIGELWAEAERGTFGKSVHHVVGAYIVAAMYDFCSAFAAGLTGWQSSQAERERRWPVFFGLGIRGVWSRWEDPSSEEQWPQRIEKAKRPGNWFNFKMAMRMTKYSTVRRVDPLLFRAAGNRPDAEIHAISALFYYFFNMKLEQHANDKWEIEYKGQAYNDSQLAEPEVWIAAYEAAGRRDFDAFVRWYDARKAALAGYTFEFVTANGRVSIPLL